MTRTLRFAAILTGLCITALWGLPLIAWAVDTAPATAGAAVPVVTTAQRELWQTLLLPIVSVVGLFIAAFLTLGLKKLTQLLEAKFKVDVPQSIEDLMSEKALQLIAWAEEKAENKLLHGDGKATPSAEKADMVVKALTQFAEGLGYGKTWQGDKIKQLVEGVLHLNRADGAGVVGSDGARAAALATVVATATPVVATPKV
jgi:hypothetical protein